MLCCDEGFSVLGSAQKIFKLGKLNKPQLRKPKGPIQRNIIYHLCWIKKKNTHTTEITRGKKCGQHCFWLDYRLLIFISSDFSIIQLRKSVHKPRERTSSLPEIHKQLLVFVHNKITTTRRGQLRFWPKVCGVTSTQLSFSLIIIFMERCRLENNEIHIFFFPHWC